jgi:hypothetical protein
VRKRIRTKLAMRAIEKLEFLQVERRPLEAASRGFTGYSLALHLCLAPLNQETTGMLCLDRS